MLELPPVQTPVQTPVDARHANGNDSLPNGDYAGNVILVVILQLFTLAALPLAWRLFARLPVRGYPLAKALGLLLVAYVLWLGATLHVLPNSFGGAVVALIVVAGGPGGWVATVGGAMRTAYVRWQPG